MKTEEEKKLIQMQQDTGIVFFRSEQGRITMKQALRYEIESTWWVGLISYSWLQEIVSRYFAWKVKKKYKRYLFNSVL